MRRGHRASRGIRAGFVCLAALGVAGWLSGCAQTAGSYGSSGISAAAAAGVTQGQQEDNSPDTEQLQKLLAEREQDAFSSRLSIGPGDVLEVSAPDVPELKKVEARVSEDGTISLPIAGLVHVGGMSEEQVKEALLQHLGKLVKNPELDVFVKEYRSREVAVIGMVHKPGLYTLASRSETILDIISQAGGMEEHASSRIVFIPASSGKLGRETLTKELFAGGESEGSGDETADAAPVASRRSVSLTQGAEKPERVERVAPPPGNGAASQPPLGSGIPAVLNQPGPIAIDLTGASKDALLEVPVRPGDVIIVPPAGEVAVDGWVQNPGAFKIAPGMTALGAVSAAGGAMFSSKAEVLRTNADGSRIAIPVDLSNVKAGTEPDVPVQAGDVVFVQRSMVGAVPYGLYTIFTHFGTGLYAAPAMP
jgi:polysaccharide export outer membrane protein